MSWSLSKPDVALRVTKFAPRVIAGLSAEARAALRVKRDRECRKVKVSRRGHAVG